MRFSIGMAYLPADQYVPLAKAAEDAGFHGVACSDHVLNLETLKTPYPYTKDGSRRWPEFTPWLDPWVAIGAMAAVTERLRFFTNIYSGGQLDTNSFNNSITLVPVSAASLGLLANGTGTSKFQYFVATFDRDNQEVDETPYLTYDVANPGLVETQPAATAEPFMDADQPNSSIPITYNGANFMANASRGVLLLHMHNGAGSRADAVAFRKPVIRSFSPTSARAGASITISGSNFGPGTQVTFSVNQPATSVRVLTPNTLVAVVPAGATSGPITVSNAAGSTAKGGFTVLP